MKKTLALLTLSLLISTKLLAVKSDSPTYHRIPIELHKLELNHLNEIDLKDLLFQHSPELSLYNFRLDQVIMNLKSLEKNSMVKLKIGEYANQPVIIKPMNKKFNNISANTLQRLSLKNYSRTNNGEWKLKTGGSLMIDKITIILKNIEHERNLRESLQCENNDIEKKSVCRSRGVILSAEVARSLTSLPCVRNVNWGIEQKNSIWVSQGCKAVFNLSIKK